MFGEEVLQVENPVGTPAEFGHSKGLTAVQPNVRQWAKGVMAQGSVAKWTWRLGRESWGNTFRNIVLGQTGGFEQKREGSRGNQITKEEKEVNSINSPLFSKMSFLFLGSKYPILLKKEIFQEAD
jgi:hypothetical protein